MSAVARPPAVAAGEPEAITVHARDGRQVIAHRFAARAPQGAGRAMPAVVIAPAMAVPQDFYFAFASWLAQRGFEVYTFDYRGIGRARPASLRGFRASMHDWIAHDYDAVVRHASGRSPGGRVLAVGHSLGGQVLGLLPSRDAVSALVTVASGTGYWRDTTARMQRYAPLFWFVMVPLSLPVFGYFPGRRIRAIGDLPAAAMRQWRRWCLNRDYLVGVEPGAAHAYAQLRLPILSVSFVDDEMMTARGIDSLHRHYRGAAREHWRIDPRAERAPRVGHFGFFRPASGERYWARVADWLEHAAVRRPDAARDEKRRETT